MAQNTGCEQYLSRRRRLFETAGQFKRLQEVLSRKGAKKTLRNAAALCVFAPLREKCFLP
jgi:hypothetical protein